MSEHIKIAAGLSAFVVAFAMIMSMGGATLLLDEEQQENYDISDEDLRISPEFEVATERTIDLEQGDVRDVENLTFYEFEDDGHDRPSFDSGWGLSEGESSGELVIDLPRDTRQVNFESSYSGFWLASCGVVGYVFIDGSEDSRNVCGATVDESVIDWDSPSIRVEFSEQDKFLYEVTVRDAPEKRFYDHFVEWTSSGVTALMSWFTLLTGLPGVLFWVGVFFGMVATLVIIEMVLW